MSKSLDKILVEYREKQPKLQASIVREAVNTDARTVELSFSSEEPVERWFGNEVLSHDGGACDLSRLKRNAPLLLNHDTRQQIGVVETCAIGSDKKGRAKVRFSKSALGQEIFQDVQDGIRSLVSVGYEVRKMELMKKDGELDTYRVTDWCPLEISLVSIPADIAVGVGRNQPLENTPTMTQTPTQEAAPEIRSAPAVAPQPKIEEIRANTRKEMLEKANSFREIGNQANASDIAEKAIREDWEKERFLEEILVQRKNARPLTDSEMNPNLGVSERDINNYSILRAIQKSSAGKLDGLERELSDEVAKRCKRQTEGFFVPHDIMGSRARAQRAQVVQTATAGGYLVDQNQVGSMIELLRNAMVFSSLGATSLSGLRGDVLIPKQTGGATAYWLDETETVTDSEATFGQLKLTPKRIAAAIPFSKQLVTQSSIDIEAFVRQEMATAIGIEMDETCINGSGADGEPIGILNATGVSTVTFSAAATWAKILSFTKTLKTNNALRGSVAWLTTPAVEEKWKTTVRYSSTASPLWTDENTVNGYRAVTTNQFPSGDKVIYGNFADYITASWDGVEITTDPYSLATSAQIRVIINMLVDAAVRQPKSFVISTDSGAQ